MGASESTPAKGSPGGICCAGGRNADETATITEARAKDLHATLVARLSREKARPPAVYASLQLAVDGDPVKQAKLCEILQKHVDSLVSDLALALGGAGGGVSEHDIMVLPITRGTVDFTLSSTMGARILYAISQGDYPIPSLRMLAHFSGLNITILRVHRPVAGSPFGGVGGAVGGGGGAGGGGAGGNGRGGNGMTGADGSPSEAGTPRSHLPPGSSPRVVDVPNTTPRTLTFEVAASEADTDAGGQQEGGAGGVGGVGGDGTPGGRSGGLVGTPTAGGAGEESSSSSSKDAMADMFIRLKAKMNGITTERLLSRLWTIVDSNATAGITKDSLRSSCVGPALLPFWPRLDVASIGSITPTEWFRFWQRIERQPGGGVERVRDMVLALIYDGDVDISDLAMSSSKAKERLTRVEPQVLLSEVYRVIDTSGEEGTPSKRDVQCSPFGESLLPYWDEIQVDANGRINESNWGDTFKRLRRKLGSAHYSSMVVQLAYVEWVDTGGE